MFEFVYYFLSLHTRIVSVTILQIQSYKSVCIKLYKRIKFVSCFLFNYLFCVRDDL